MTQDVQTLVLGAGPVGLLCARVLGAPCVGERPGGGDLLRWVAPSLIWANPRLEGILAGLSLKTGLRDVRFGFWGPRGIGSDVTKEERAEYLRRSGRDPNAAPSSAMSSGKDGRIAAFKCTTESLTQALLDVVDVKVARVTSVELTANRARSVVRTTAGDFTAGRIVNTLPAPVLDALLVLRGFEPLPPVENARRKWFICGGAWSQYLREVVDDGLEWLYVTDPRIPFDRVTFLEGNVFSYEFNSEPPSWFPETVSGKMVINGLAVQVTGPSRPLEAFAGSLLNFGRMARWDHRIRLHDVAEEVSRVR
jgi:hypothetical protein